MIRRKEIERGDVCCDSTVTEKSLQKHNFLSCPDLAVLYLLHNRSVKILNRVCFQLPIWISAPNAVEKLS